MSDDKVQAVFDRVIDAGIYPEEPFMCVALTRAEHAGVINDLECVLAKYAIGEYLGPLLSIREAHVRSSLSDFKGCTSEWANIHGVGFYRNWADRPELG